MSSGYLPSGILQITIYWRFPGSIFISNSKKFDGYPIGIAESETMTVSYSLWIPEDFDFVLGI
jgi:hypothetical protein